MDKNDIKKMIFRAVKASDTDEQGAIEYDTSAEFESKTGVSRVRVILRNGRIRQAFPKDDDLTWVNAIDDWKDNV